MGKYFVKLKYLGTNYKVEVDDYFPIDILTCENLLPTTDKHEIWSMILSKALMKFFHFKYKLLDIGR